MSDTPDQINTDPIKVVKALRERVSDLEAQVEAIKRLLDSNLPAGVARAWPARGAPSQQEGNQG